MIIFYLIYQSGNADLSVVFKSQERRKGITVEFAGYMRPSIANYERLVVIPAFVSSCHPFPMTKLFTKKLFVS